MIEKEYKENEKQKLQEIIVLNCNSIDDCTVLSSSYPDCITSSQVANKECNQLIIW